MAKAVAALFQPAMVIFRRAGIGRDHVCGGIGKETDDFGVEQWPIGLDAIASLDGLSRSMQPVRRVHRG